MTNFEETVELVRLVTPEEMAAHGVLSAAGKSGYVCPTCGNGTGDDGTGIDFADKGSTHVAHCFKCGADFDTVAILAHYFKLDAKTQFKEVIARAAELFGLGDIDLHRIDRDAPKSSEPPEKNFTDFINSARRFLDKFLQERGGTFRGLNKADFTKARCGYFERMTNSSVARLVIPTYGDLHYIARAVDDDALKAAGEKKALAPYGGTKRYLFLHEDLLTADRDDTFFLVEGELDALSIAHCGFKAVAIGCAQLTKKQRAELASLKVKPKIIVMLDDDEAGQNSAPKCVKQLLKLGFRAVKARLNIGTKDANSALQADENALRLRLDDILADCQNKFVAAVRFDESSELAKMRDFFPNCPVDAFIPRGFFIAEDTIWQEFKTQDAERVGAPCVVERLFVSHGYDSAKMTVALFDARRDTWNSHTFSFEVLSDARAFGKLMASFGNPVTSKSAARLADFLSEMILTPANREIIPQVNFFTKIGWTDDTFKQYILPTDLNGESPVLNGSFDYAKAFKPRGSAQKLREMLINAIGASTTARIVIGASVVAPLIRPLGVRNIQIHQFAPSGSGKSALNFLSTAIWQDPLAARQTFSSTPNLLDLFSSKFNDNVVLIEEAQSASKTMRKSMENFLYNFENGQTRGRLNKDAEEKDTVQYAGVRLTSGERPITEYTGGQGAKNRVIELSDPKIFYNRADAIKCHQVFHSKQHTTCAHFARPWIDYIVAHLPQIAKKRDQILRKFRRAGAFANGVTGFLTAEEIDNLSDEQVGLIPSHVQMLSAIFAALYAFCDMLEPDLAEVVEDLLDADIHHFVREYSESRLVDISDRALTDIRDAILSRDRQFQREAPNGREIFPQAVGVESLGVKFNNGTVAFYPTSLRKLIAELGYEAFEPIIQGLARKNILAHSNSRTHKYQKCLTLRERAGEGEIAKKQAWLYVLKGEAEE